MKNILGLGLVLACGMLAGCASPGSTQQGAKVADTSGYAPTGTFIKRKDGEGLGPTLIGTVPKQETENARAMMSSGQGSRYW
ncbi:hypothetical protein LE190_02810 [Massilia oculi]|uniref:Lipoprotein n=1 Tax=Massilia hydrophila TaxID=3044279 RepID=A0ABS7Y6Z4_9BURK|nr:hypothetical protein [Massilia oculi]MCA1854862.1 hypothetical protein [Massilia oculi]